MKRSCKVDAEFLVAFNPTRVANFNVAQAACQRAEAMLGGVQVSLN